MSGQFSAEYIRSQPEFQFLACKERKEGKASINLNDLSLRIMERSDDKDTSKSEDTGSARSTPRSREFVLQSQPSPFRPVTSPDVNGSTRTSSRSSTPSFTLACPTGDKRRSTPRPQTAVPIFPHFLMRGYGLDDAKKENPDDEPRRLRRKSSNYDPTTDKTQQFLKGFSQASRTLMPLKRGLRRVEVHYSETNVHQNDSRIFADLIKNAHKANIICQENVDNLERRLLTKRTDLKKATTFYDIYPLPPSSIALPRSARIGARTVAAKKEERKKRIKKKDEKLKLGYEPRVWSLKSPTEEEYKNVVDCRYLRVSPKYQPELYGIKQVEYSERPKTVG
ncbi:hypothetical protein LOTGIDRAFT_161604 [Lottia gigantea]|uniref:Uncharacterized protein n=1 Tax=Lottia gigantea TaxID=225164 RepID=V4A9T0_LOTGI|nr:hypothetical protein LOTGIDRAFT_161604 [Lottia gigantea]ESO93502.1 hypothetical protein LOTGIDRAFT_161604 [Lottia gigantea]